MLDTTRDFFDTLAKVLLRCWIFGFVLLLIWLGVVLIGGESIHKMQGPMFGVSDHEFSVIFYCGIEFLKLLVLVCFFIPWLAIKLVLRSTKR